MSTVSMQGVAQRVLESLAGPGAQLRDGQREALEHLSRPDAKVLVVQATGWGKSAVYWVATAWSRAQGGGPTLVVSPLLSLMRDQVAAATRAGLTAATLNSSNLQDWSGIEAALQRDEVDLLLVSPERLANPRFGQRVLAALTERLGLLVIDEAHSISDWGHDFRPDYRRIARVLQGLAPGTPVLATTATANARVVADVAAQLGAQTAVLRGPLARSSLHLAVLPELSPLQRYAWVLDHARDLPGSGIIYTLTVSDAQRLATAWQQAFADDPQLQAFAYTGQLSADDRERLEDDLRDGRIKALIATSALGMGFDKPDLGFVVHVGAPPSPVSYYQQVGRAGRGIDRAVVALLPSAADTGVWEYFATATIPRPEHVERILAALEAQDDAVSVPQLEAETGIRRTRIELLLKQLAVDDVARRTADGWSRGPAPWSYDAAHFDELLALRHHEADIMRDYVQARRCLMQLLSEALDDPAAAPCGRCSVCLGRLPEPLTASVDPRTVSRLSAVLREEQHELVPRKMWPGGVFGARGRIPAALAAEPGRVLVHADAAEWEELRRGALATDGPPPPELRDAAVGCMTRWRHEWSRRPELIVSLLVQGHDQLANGLAAHLGGVGRIPVAQWTIGPVRLEEPTSAAEALAWRGALTATQPPDVTGRPVLLLVDATSSGWVVTVAAAVLREHGASCVLPMLIHRTL